MTKPLWLVTGGAGFIGSNIAETLVKRGERVRVVDDFSTGKASHIVSFKRGIELVRGDIRKLADVRKAMKGVTYVIHQAALRSVRVPTLVLHGDADPLVPLACGVDTAESVPGARLVVIPGMGHALPISCWKRIVEEIATHAA